MTGPVRGLTAALGFVLVLGLLSAGALALQRHVLDPARSRPAAAVAANDGPAAATAVAPAAAPEAAAPERPREVTRGSARTTTGGAARGVPTDVPVVDPAWAATTAERAGIPLPAVTAYGRATLMAPEDCAIGWTTLAGIGWVESHHGTIDGRTIGEDAVPSEPILGPALDGKEFAAIPATAESSQWHGDPDWDHAVGPLQLIPSTWERWAADGDGDGVEDPHDLDDAALAAARYLCFDGHDLTTGAGWSAAVFSYNHEQAYVAAVHAAATAYAERTSP